MNHSELAHKWAHAGPDASRRCGSMSFQGDTLYSYGTPIAKIYRNKRGVLVLSSEHSYSVSTSKHLSHARRAVSHMDHLSVPRYIIGSHGTGRYRYSVSDKQDHAENLEFFTKCAADHLASAKRAQSRQAAAWRAEAAARNLKEWQHYAAFFGIRRKAPAYPAAEWTAALQRADRIENPDPASIDKRERDRAKRQERNRERDEYLAEQRRSIQAAKRARDFYRIGAARSSFRLDDAWGHDYEALRSSPVLLRAQGEIIETSHGARVPLAAAPMVWNLVQRATAEGGRDFSAEFARRERAGINAQGGFKSVRIGDYPLDRIDADGTLHAGCHSIPFSELALMARQLKLEGGANG